MKKLLALLAAVLLLFVTGCKQQQKAAPTALTVQINSAVTLQWNAADETEFYRIYRVKEGQTDYRFLTDTEETSFTDTTAEENLLYRYKVTAVCGNRESAPAVSELCGLKTAEQQTVQALQKPVISSVTVLDKYTTAVLFSSQSNNCSFEIWRSTAPNGNFQKIGTTEETVYYDSTANHAEYYYKVTAVNGQGERQTSAFQKTGKNKRAVFGVPVIMYHEFVTQKDLDSGVAFDEYAIWQTEFEKDLKWLKKNGYTTVTTQQLANCLEGQGTLPAKPILLTADDGKLGVYKNAYPLLKQYGMTLSLALIGYEIDAATRAPEARSESIAPYCTWTEIAEMAASGAVEMISHTQKLHVFSHDNRNGANAAEGESAESFLPSAQADFMLFNNNLKSHTGRQTVAMAYPYSKRSLAADKAWLKSGYKLLLGGDDDNERLTYSNYFIAEAGVNTKSAVLRRLVRLNKTPLQDLLNDATEHDNY